MPQAVITPNFDSKQRVSLAISMSCSEWDKLGQALSGMKGEPFQSTADAILQGLVKVGYFSAAEETAQ